MYLKSIEVHGFKSFANKIKFEFHNGITGIVGPNGSGKSNVADAVRWVLGEQRIKQLRGASMQDVIFSGTELRKPLGFAYVAITLDNSDHSLSIDFEEVTVARKLYRSGESEYLLNGTPCRLKDVNELFYDTGIGKEGYSIIGQGQIDKILSGKPEERRELFDEAAGIVKFKKRKAFSLKKLEDEKQNLTRVNDILSELERRIGPLEKQSDKAKEYLKYKEELKKYDVNLFLLESQRVSESIEEVSGKLNIASEAFENNKKEFESIKTTYDEIQLTVEELDKSIEEKRSSLANTNTTRTKLEGQINVLNEQINSAKNNVAHFNSRLEILNTDVEAKENEINLMISSKSSDDSALDELKNKKAAVYDELSDVRAEIEKINDDIEKDKNSIIDTINDRASVKAELSRYDTMMSNATIRKSQLNSKLLQAKTDEEKQHEIIEALEKEFERITEEIKKQQYDQKLKEEEVDRLHSDISDLEKQLSDAQIKYHSDNSKLEAISNMTERYEGYNSAIRKVMEKKSEEDGLVGVVADIIKVDKEYETAIEIALGNNIQNIVTEDEDVATRMISYLKREKLGRATFLPLTSITNPQEFKNPDSLDEKGVIGLASEIVTTKDEYKNVAKAMVGRILVVDNIYNARAIAKKYNYGIRMVTLDGELLVPGGAISGGAFKNNSNLLGRRREMDELESNVKSSLLKCDELMKKIDDTKKTRNKLRITIEEINISIQDLFLQQNTARLNVNNAEEKISETAGDVDSLYKEESDINNQVEEIKNKKAELEEKLSNSTSFEKDTESRIAQSQAVLESMRVKENDLSEKLHSHELELEKATQKLEFENQNVERIRNELKRFVDERQEILESLKKNEDDILLKVENIEEIKKTIEASHSTESEDEKLLGQMITQKEELSEKQKTFFERREELGDRINDLDKEVYRLTGQKDKLSESIASLTGYMWNEYELSFVDAQALKDDSLNDLGMVKKAQGEYRDKIKRLGDINVNAIEEFKQESERYEFLKTQHDDLIQAEKDLENIIAELDEAMRNQFMAKFGEISTEFDKVFKEMFGGGKGTLELMDEGDILEAGIRIIAQPPGKKLQNMMQLSGGEKSLAAIALLFAIQNLKPSPFCLLDEIEAALDESNVDRFAGYLHKLTKYTQFIVITHRRGTMEKADRLYGITMQEKGVSALVSVNLIDDDVIN